MAPFYSRTVVGQRSAKGATAFLFSQGQVRRRACHLSVGMTCALSMSNNQQSGSGAGLYRYPKTNEEIQVLRTGVF
jgi:hypothetical protein